MQFVLAFVLALAAAWLVTSPLWWRWAKMSRPIGSIAFIGFLVFIHAMSYWGMIAEPAYQSVALATTLMALVIPLSLLLGLGLGLRERLIKESGGLTAIVVSGLLFTMYVFGALSVSQNLKTTTDTLAMYTKTASKSAATGGADYIVMLRKKKMLLGAQDISVHRQKHYDQIHKGDRVNILYWAPPKLGGTVGFVLGIAKV